MHCLFHSVEYIGMIVFTTQLLSRFSVSEKSLYLSHSNSVLDRRGCGSNISSQNCIHSTRVDFNFFQRRADIVRVLSTLGILVITSQPTSCVSTVWETNLISH